MSLETVREDFWQSTARSTIRERCKSIFNQELLSDVKFVVGDSHGGSECESKMIPAHKFVLAISSPVFFAMFYGELAETKDSVHISDCEYESLVELFRFIYSDEANLNPDNVMQLMYLAKKYMLPCLADKCSAYLQENLDASNVFHVLPDVQKYEEKDLLDHCWKVIEKETTEAVKSDGFVTIERSILEEVVEKESLNIKELELFKAVDRWAEKECRKQGIAAEGSVKRRILGERIVKGIRFPVMEQREFADVVLDSDILTHKENYGLMKYFSSVLKTPVGFSKVRRAGCREIISRFTSVKIGWRYTSSIRSNAIGVSVTKNIKLHSLRLFGNENSEYSVTLTVKDPNGGVIATDKGIFMSKHIQSEVGDYQGFDIVFVTPLALKANTCYSFKAGMTGPVSWYGEGGQSSVGHSGVTFSFTSIKNTAYSPDFNPYGYSGSQDSNVRKGQFSEFCFTVD